jgi:hypothetical protein
MGLATANRLSRARTTVVKMEATTATLCSWYRK